MSESILPPQQKHAHIMALRQTLERHGWDIRTVEIDLIANRAIVEIHRFDGRWIYLAGSPDSPVNLERWHRTPTVYRYRGGPECDGFNDQFLGRSRPEGLRSGLRSLCTYLADNPAPGFPALDTHEVRRLFATVL